MDYTATFRRRDLTCIFAVFLLAAAASFSGSARIGPLINQIEAHNVWFDADAPLVYNSMTNTSAHHRSSKHPLFFPLAYAPVKVMRVALSPFGVGVNTCVRLTLAMLAGAWAFTLYAVLRAKGTTIEAVTFTVLALSTAGFLFWSPIPETFLLGSLSILVALCAVAYKDRLPHPTLVSLSVQLLTLGITITNWLVGILSTVVLQRRRAALITLAALLTVGGSAWVQSAALDTTGAFFDPLPAKAEIGYITASQDISLLSKWRAFFGHAVLIPKIQAKQLGTCQHCTMISVQNSHLQWKVAAWALLLILGAIALVRKENRSALSACILVSLAGQFALHSVYGVETLLFSAHYTPLLVLVASWATEINKPVALGLAWIVSLVAGFNNLAELKIASDLLRAVSGC